LAKTTSWQRERAKTRQPYLPKLVLTPATPCHICHHPRSSHSLVIVQARCKAQDCDCVLFEPICGCGHLLCSHTWGSGDSPWSCYQCECKRFGASQEGAA